MNMFWNIEERQKIFMLVSIDQSKDGDGKRARREESNRMVDE